MGAVALCAIASETTNAPFSIIVSTELPPHNNLKTRFAEKRGGKEGFAAFEELSEFVQEKAGVEESFEAEELEKSINFFVKNLPEKERNIFIRRYFFFESMNKIGERYGFSENRVSVILFRTRKKLRKYLEKEGLL